MPAAKTRKASDLIAAKWKRQLESEKVHEWRDHYMDVDAIVKSMYSGYGTSSEGDSSSPDTKADDKDQSLKHRGTKPSAWRKVQGAFLCCDDNIIRTSMLQAFEQEVNKVNAWAEKQLHETSAKLDLVVPYVKEYVHLSVGDKRILRDAVIQIYMLFMLLDDFCSLNCVIFHQAGKFLHAENNDYVLWIVKNVHDPPAFVKIMTTDLRQKMVVACQCYAEMEGLTVAGAQEQLQSKLQAPMPSFREGLHLGLYVGMSIPLLIADLYFFFLPRPADDDIMFANFPIFRGTAVVILGMWMWGICVKLMDQLHINYAFILDLDPATRLHWKQTMEFAAFWTNLWLWTHCIFSIQVRFDVHIIPEAIIPTSFIPAAFFIFAVCLFLCPFNMVYRPTRWWILRQIQAVLCSPLVPVTFASNFVGDYLTSMVKALIDINYSICFIYSSSWLSSNASYCTGQGYVAFVLTLLPLNCRLLQCLRRYWDDRRSTHLWNFGKYATSTTAVLVGIFNPHYGHAHASWSTGRIIYILLLIASTIYSWVWDVFQDWGLYVRKSDGKWVARPVLGHVVQLRSLLPALDLIGRCAWAYTIVVDPPGERFGVAFLVFFTAMVEVTRRSMWAVVRFGNEQYYNASQYRVVKEVPLGRLHVQPLSQDGAGMGSDGHMGEFVRWISKHGDQPSPLSTSPLSGPSPPAKSAS